jgi:CRP-like cAMP-binding protein
MSISGLFPIDKWDFRSQSVLRDLPAEDLDGLTANQIVQTYRKGEIIFKEGGPPSGIFYIISGKVKKYKAVEGKGEQIIYIANTGELLGYHAVLSRERFPDSASTLEESEIGFIPKEDFMGVLERSTMLSGRLLKTLSHEFTVFVNGLALFAQRTVRERLALQLIVLREKYKVNFQPGIPVVIDLSREDLASLVGTARENVVRSLSQLKDEGAIQTKGRKIVVVDVKRLIEIADYK